MVDVAQLAERQVVVLDVVGSTPTIHPILRPSFVKTSEGSYEQGFVWQARKNLQIRKKNYTLLMYLNYLKYSGCGAIW
jgi:hypothetical protein